MYHFLEYNKYQQKQKLELKHVAMITFYNLVSTEAYNTVETFSTSYNTININRNLSQS